MRKIAGLAAVFLLLFAGSGCEGSQGTDTVSPPTENNAGSQAETGEPESEESGRYILVKSGACEVICQLNNSRAAQELYQQLPLTVEVEPFSDNEMTFYPERLNAEDAPPSAAERGSLAYYAPWGDVVLFYAAGSPGSGLYELGSVISGVEEIEKLSGTITVSAYE